MAKFNYRGKDVDELKKLPESEWIKLLPARIRRTLKREQAKKYPKLFKRMEEGIKAVSEGKMQKPIKTHRRNLVITPKMVGLIIHVHSGNEFKKVVITERMIGHYVSEYAFTRKPVKHSAPGVGASRSSKFVPVK